MMSSTTNNNRSNMHAHCQKNVCCELCTCGPNCQCTETLCRCEASSVLNSLAGTRSRSISPIRRINPSSSSSCCSSSKGKNNEKCNSYNTFDNVHSNNNNTSSSMATEVDIVIRGMTCSMCK